jgi:hypothetical protein
VSKGEATLRLLDKTDKEILKLPRAVKGAIYDFQHKFRKDPGNPGLRLKQLKGDSRLYAARVTQDYRALLLHVGGQDYLLVAVKPRGEVYENLDRYSYQINPISGGIEFVDLVSIESTILTPAVPAGAPAREAAPATPVPVPAVPAPPVDGPAALFEAHSDSLLLDLGVAEPLLSLIRKITSEDELLGLTEYAPQLTGEVLLALYDGKTPDEVLEQVTRPVSAEELVDAEDYEAALARPATQVTTDDIALKGILEEGFERWQVFLHPTQHLLPHPFTPADRAAGYRYDISVLQAEFSLTQMLDKPVTGRIFFEQVIRDNLDIGRPDQVSLVFDRRIHRKGKNTTPGRFRTRVITTRVTPSLHIDYKSSRIKQYHKQGRALRTETTINNTYDFGVGRKPTNLPALRKIGFTANKRLLGVQRLSHDPITGAEAFHTTCDPIIHPDGTRTAGLRFTDPRAQALLHLIVLFRLQVDGFTNADLRRLLAELLHRPFITPNQATYDLRRLREHGLIHRIPHSHRYHVTDLGLRHATFLAATHDQVLMTGMAELHQASRLAKAARTYQTAIDDLARRAGTAA